MNNFQLLSVIAKQITKVGENIESVSNCLSEIDKNLAPDVYSSYQRMLLNEVENVQLLTLSLTGQITENGDFDLGREDSAFFEGELDDDIGDKTDKEVLKPGSVADREEG